MKAALASLLVAAAFLSGTAAASDAESRVRGEIQGYLEAWNSGDAERLASFYMEDGDRANNRGQMFHGRTAIREHYEKVFAAPPADGGERRLTYDRVDVRLVSAEAAVVDVRYEVRGIGAELDRAVRGRNSVFMIKEGERWMRAAHRNSLPISPACLKTCADRDLLPWE